MAAKKWPNSRALHSILFFFLSSIEERKKKRIECRAAFTNDFFAAMDFPHVLSERTTLKFPARERQPACSAHDYTSCTVVRGARGSEAQKYAHL